MAESSVLLDIEMRMKRMQNDSAVDSDGEGLQE